MAAGRTIEAVEQREAAATQPAQEQQLGFGAEYRELARQRRFTRSDAAAATPAPAAPAADVPQTWHAAMTPPAPTSAPTPPTAAPASEPVAARVATAADRASARMSADQRAMLAELARMSDRLVESREALAVALTRADRAEQDVAASAQRLMAAQALVQDAQRATRESAERCTWLEGRCETLQEALELAVNASMLTRWRWRRQQRALQG